MKIKHFEKKIKHLTQWEVLSGAVSTLSKILVRKGYVSRSELQSGILEWMKANGLEDPESKRFEELTFKELCDLEDKYSATLGHCWPKRSKVSKKKKGKK